MNVSSKRQDFPPGLWVVATPIGNLGDFTDRARQALEEADQVLCEDTRRTAQLLSACKIPDVFKRLARLDAHVRPQQIEKWVQALKEGHSLALVSDAGTPAISDPGAALVAVARKEGVRVVPIPGASAVASLLSVSGFMETEFFFGGFFPREEEERKKLIEQMEKSPLARIFVWFESPKRIQSALSLLAEMRPEAHAVVGKELTKIHEKFFWGPLAETAQQVTQELENEGEVGEWCFALQLPKRASDPSFLEEEVQDSENESWMKALRCLLELGVSPSEAARKVSHHFAIAKNKVYKAALKLSDLKLSEKS